MGLAYLENGCVVLIPYLCIKASSTVRSSLRLTGTGRLCVYTGFSFFGFNFTLKSLLMPMSRRWRAKISLYSIITSLSCCFSSPCMKESSLWNVLRKSSRDSLFSVWFNFSFCSNSLISLRMRFWMGVCSASFPGFSGVGNQNRFVSEGSESASLIRSHTWLCHQGPRVVWVLRHLMGVYFLCHLVWEFVVQLFLCWWVLCRGCPYCLLPLFWFFLFSIG